MGIFEIEASDGHRLSAYESHPDDAAAAIVVLQEVFGVNGHVRSVVDRFAALGYRAIAPALFDRVERGVELPYSHDSMVRGRGLRDNLDWDVTVGCDIAAAVDRVAGTGPVAVVGYCYGGSLAWLSACALGDRIAASVGYYGGQVHQFVDRTPAAPVLLNFGSADPMIPLADVEAVAAAHPGVIVHVYEGADHGFNCDVRASYHEAASALALRRTLGFLTACGVG